MAAPSLGSVKVFVHVPKDSSDAIARVCSFPEREIRRT
ncbi:hypothetical protein SO3561_09142 [Streptomyces olivochromogenes]|uniref:Uncharacterized protein n=1 Tax=Streptomyces olivochromogenes TaxID=1963 RepID=A0A250VU66_STROL|nr:hypothetical protein SO3561_09142 [Streptomyces olivochromogenes]